MTNRARWMVVLTAVLLSGCDTYHYVAGTIHEDARRPARAIGHYESFLAHRPKDPRACEVRLRTADIYRHFFGRCQEARRHYETAARDFPWMRACADRAKAGLLVCPDFFPTDPGRTWIYVDSASGGKAMRLEWSTGASSTSIQTALYAGNKRIQQSVDHYQKMDWAIWRVDGDGREAILRYPYTETLSWPAKRGKTAIEYLVVGDSVAVRSKAGAFSGCLKVRETDLRFKKSWKYDYYCPGVGRVKTTVGGPGFENPNTELLRYDGGLVELSR